MTVADLLALLIQADQTLEVYRQDYEFGPDPVEGIRVIDRPEELPPNSLPRRAVVLVIE